MKKQFAVLLALSFVLSGCSYLSALNPWGTQPLEENAGDVNAEPEVRSVNRYLWLASVEKMSNMPLKEKNLRTGTIESNWMVVNGVPDEKFQITVRVLCPELRADGVKVSVQKMNRVGKEWVKTLPDHRLASEIEKIILKQASVLYRNAVAAGEE